MGSDSAFNTVNCVVRSVLIQSWLDFVQFDGLITAVKSQDFGLPSPSYFPISPTKTHIQDTSLEVTS